MKWCVHRSVQSSNNDDAARPLSDDLTPTLAQGRGSASAKLTQRLHPPSFSTSSVRSAQTTKDLTNQTAHPRLSYTPAYACATMRFHPPTLLLLLGATLASADDLVTKTRIKVQLFAGPAFVSEVSVDAYDKQCLSLDNNLFVGLLPPTEGGSLLMPMKQD